MAIPNLREAFETQTGPVVDLGNKVWQVSPNDTLKFKRSVVGDGALILVSTARDRATSALVARGTDQHFKGFTVKGQRPTGAPFDKYKEAQHFIDMRGVQGGSVENVTFEYGWGDAVYLDRDPDTLAWSKDIQIIDCTFNEMGRHHVTPNAVDNLELLGGEMGWSVRSAVDVEPPSKGSGARYFRWSGTTITAKGNNFPVFANGGVGTANTVHHITLENIHCPNRPFSLTVNPDPTDPKLRRSDYAIRNCSGKGPTGVSRPQLIFRKVDRIALAGIVQPTMPGVPLALFDNCTAVTSDA